MPFLVSSRTTLWMNGLLERVFQRLHLQRISKPQLKACSACKEQTSTTRTIMTNPYLVYCTPAGEIREEVRLRALAFGNQPLAAAHLIPLPDGVTLSMMPDRLAVGEKPSGERQVMARSRGWAAAALLPIGYTRTHLPAYEKVPGTEPLPFFGYSAVASMHGRLYVAAIQADDAIVSFGQGCEGEPLLQYRRIEQAIKAMRERTDKGVININTNASNLRWLQRLYDAGLDTIRASTISGHPQTYTAYYRPIGYSFEDVKASLRRARDAGVYSSINLLCFPGMIDRKREVEALLAFVKETGVRLIQLRNLNIDPEVLLPRMPSLDSMGKALGVRAMIEILKREVPEVEIGNFTRPVKRTKAVAATGR